MAGDWVPMRFDLPDDPNVLRIARLTGLAPDHIVGKLHRFWTWVSQHSTDGHVDDVTEDWIDNFLDCPRFAYALIDVGWLRTDLMGITIPHWERWNGQLAQARLKAALRSASARNRKRIVATVTYEALSEQEWFPDCLKSAAFAEVWNDWIAHRREIKKAATVRAAKMQIAKMQEWGHARAIEAIRYSVAQGWSGIFEAGRRGAPSTGADRQGGRLEAESEKYDRFEQVGDH